jgi:bicarbonate transport system substrate-binding protein
MAPRRRFMVLLSGALSTTMLLTGCLGNPPNRQGGTPTAAITKVPVAVTDADLEVKTVSLGYIPILELHPW